MTEIYGAHFPI